jgi:hypothetical protein
MTALNFPAFEPRLQYKQQKTLIWDIIRKKFIVLTPEEWVRQHTIHFLTQQLRYPAQAINVEKKLTFNGMTRRLDVIVFGKNAVPRILIECKAPEVPLDDKVCRQIAVYQQAVPCRWLMITNGMNHFFFEKIQKQEEFIWKPVLGLPQPD